MPKPSVQPVVWTPPTAPERAKRTRSDVPLPPLRVLDVIGGGPEDVLFDAEGRILTGVDDGRVLRLDPEGRRIEVLAELGRPLGLEWLPDGRLLVCDAHRGPLAVDLATGGAEALLAEPMTFCNNAAVAPDGTVYVTDSSDRFGVEHWRADLMEHSGSGRLLRIDPSGASEVLLSGLDFANGVALAPDGSALFVAETSGYRLLRIPLAGPRAGTEEVLLENMPAFPDNISTGSDGLIWIAMASARNPILDALSSRPPLFRKLAWSTPDALQVQPKRTVWVHAVDPASGETVHDLQGDSADFTMATGVREQGGVVAMGSLTGRTIAWFRL